jgi:hypothetical protein
MPDIIDFESEKRRAEAEIDADTVEDICRKLAEIMESSKNPAVPIVAGLRAMINRLTDNGMSRHDAKTFIVERLSFIEE